MQTCGLQLKAARVVGSAERRVGQANAGRRIETTPAHCCNARLAASVGTSTSSSTLQLPVGHAVLGLLEGARRAVILKALKAHRAIRRELENGKPSGVVNGPQSGLLMLSALAIPPIPGNGMIDLVTNRVFLVGFWSWFTAQFLKIFTKRFKKGVWDVGAMLESGGMPSSHSSLCAGITTAIAIQQGFGSPLFAACLCFSVIVMYDAMGVRRHAGKQAEVLNKVIDELLDDDHPMGEVKLKEVLGHTPRQVICGGLLGLAVGLFFPA
ncbi:hypothetical protein Vretimale_15758 [Volvox reticuliferus]|uniref:Uncharacterized protein n=1 Tax=Volvox reticuliferus TaxID=1737510 RepID=A0A8J4D0Q6_9CHLO|nr:hypothetical protein Vretifemale_18405 [Volvox reticuliferus]GIM12367.1 hypothetical protein Vretimale_15758 [Volvox reticuliferus]